MIPSVDPKVSPLDLVRRVWMEIIVQPLTLGLLVLVLASGVSTGIPQSSSKVPAQMPEPHQRHTPSPSFSAATTAMPSGDHLGHQRVTSTLMTGHILTSAHVVTHRDVIQLSIKTENNSKEDK
ncbi:hypothetical protein IQ260_27795 [Leptolyngbya cf. ectocarpi LEGE 11479]|uniref:Serine protease n=1 Tax=Leptolyngbya cf. ectocarpi LEGE 11479 TaxID=1828722 RepID=A0A928ZZS8_LEPEC|nr:hypothetical protein [Leptolyngbya ectocarpi]MBE9070452.1 hypothetical protein [Leptolyngbya cf. ectocarpi LEGE 11479]